MLLLRKDPRSLYVAPNATRSATPVGNVENRTTLTECAGQSNPRPRMPSLAHVATWGERTSHTRPPRVRLNKRQMGKEAVSPPANQASVGQTDSRRLRPTEDRSTPTASTVQHRWHARYGVSELPGGYTHPPTAQFILIPVSQRMQAVNKSGIHLLGATIVEFSLPDTKAKSKQMVYVTPSVTRLFLSRATCSYLGLISPQFPSTTTAAAASSIPLPGQPRFGSPHSTPSPPSRNDKARGPLLEQINTAPQAEKRTCGCPTRSLPPTGPIPRPVPATEENMSALEQHLRKASTFNVCTHQPLPMMIGPPRVSMSTQGQHQSLYTRWTQCPFTGRTKSKSTSTAMSVLGSSRHT